MYLSCVSFVLVYVSPLFLETLSSPGPSRSHEVLLHVRQRLAPEAPLTTGPPPANQYGAHGSILWPEVSCCCGDWAHSDEHCQLYSAFLSTLMFPSSLVCRFWGKTVARSILGDKRKVSAREKTLQRQIRRRYSLMAVVSDTNTTVRMLVRFAGLHLAWLDIARSEPGSFPSGKPI